jgi:microcystin-dependent protein
MKLFLSLFVALSLFAATAHSASVVTGSGSIPAGTLIAFTGPTCPSGYIPANGATLAVSGKYAALCTVLGTTWGSPCKAPNLLNRFVRGAGAATDGNGGDTVALGSYQADVFGSHSHGASVAASNGLIFINASYACTCTSNVNPGLTVSVSASGGNETRPKAYGVTYCIKY